MVLLEDREILAQLPGLLLPWYDGGARVLPWREEPTPYRVWVSEIMLQQTRVEAVKPYYERFLSALPDVHALAQAPEEQLLKLWEGLGYYNRVRTMQKAAQAIERDFGGELPPSYHQLLALPGFGPYTAGAVASIAFGLPVPAVDGNVLRVLSRLTASFEDITKQPVRSAFAQALSECMPSRRPGDFNQSLMELGATVCLPNGAPKCMCCPLLSLCEGQRRGIAEALPVKPPKKPRRLEERTVFLLLSQGTVALHKRPPRGLLASLWEFPNVQGSLSAQEAESFLGGLGLQVESLHPLPPARHIFTHVEWAMNGYLAAVANPAGEFFWATAAQLDQEAALPSAFSAYLPYAKDGL